MTRLLFAAAIALAVHAGLAALRFPLARDFRAHNDVIKTVNITVLRVPQQARHEDAAQYKADRLPRRIEVEEHPAQAPQAQKAVSSPSPKVASLAADRHKREVRKERVAKITEAKSEQISLPVSAQRGDHETRQAQPEIAPAQEGSDEIGGPTGLKKDVELASVAPLDSGEKMSVGRESFVEATPSYLTNPPPPYPSIAKKKGYEGTVILEVLVDEKGSPSSVSISSSSGHRVLDLAALEAVSNWRFRPAETGGIPIASTVKVPVVFRLD